ncbi:unnamed protein product [Parnassius apollo]|uniref:(apollo) hypothetical protein n=1 Tax=Parnassius apollo TaxID=110799 RepID=A0A8S3XL78_PARAO|nr:unnamed protein product [Parnassius apollo]
MLLHTGHLWAAGPSCSSCGSECVSACGTRRFRTCCFNYLRRKRGPELLQSYGLQIKPANDVSHVVENFGIHEAPPQFEEPKLWWMNVLSSENPDFGSYED